MKFTALFLTLGLGSVALLPTVLASAEPTTQKSEADSKKLKLEDCPKPVQDTIKKELGSGRLQELSKETKDNKTTYNADIHVDGKNYDLVVAEDGKMLSMTQE